MRTTGTPPSLVTLARPPSGSAANLVAAPGAQAELAQDVATVDVLPKDPAESVTSVSGGRARGSAPALTSTWFAPSGLSAGAIASLLQSLTTSGRIPAAGAVTTAAPATGEGEKADFVLNPATPPEIARRIEEFMRTGRMNSAPLRLASGDPVVSAGTVTSWLQQAAAAVAEAERAAPRTSEAPPARTDASPAEHLRVVVSNDALRSETAARSTASSTYRQGSGPGPVGERRGERAASSDQAGPATSDELAEETGIDDPVTGVEAGQATA